VYVCNFSPFHSFVSTVPTLKIHSPVSTWKFTVYSFHLFHVKWVHCHHGMARPRVADRGDGFQIWRVAANILNKQSRTADSGWSSSLGVGRG
jgi:hypothetical protein